MSKPQFSVVIPLYNKAKYIRRAIESVLAQTVHGIEIIVIDDGSTDDGISLVKAMKSERIIVIEQENKGVAAARNTGIQNAKADFIAFLDADDEWKPDFLEKIVDLIRTYPDAGCYATGREFITGRGEVHFHELNRLPQDWRGLITSFFRFSIEEGGIPQSSSSVVIPKSVFYEVGMFPEGEALREDTDMWIRIALKYTVAYDNSVCVRIYHDTENNSNKKMKRKEYNGGLKVINTLRSAFEQGLVDPDEREYARVFLDISLLGYAVILIRSGNASQGRRQLMQLRGKGYRSKIMKWYLLSFLPVNLIEYLIYKLK